MELFDTHKFLFTLNYNGEVKGYLITYADKENKIKEILIDNIEIGTSPIKCAVYDNNKIKHIIPFTKIKCIKKENEIVWENPDFKINKTKIIKGWK